MATKEFFLDNKGLIEYDTDYLFLDKSKNIMRLRRRDINNNWDPSGTYPSSGTFVLPNFRADDLTELWAFVDCVYESGSNVDYQLSPDNGQTYYYVSGTDWSEASGVNDYSNCVDVDKYLYIFPTSWPPQVRIKVRLNSYATGTKSPEWEGAFIHYDHNAILYEDIGRNLIRILRQRTSVQKRDRYLVDSGASSVNLEIPTSGTLLAINKIVNLDGNRALNLLQSYNTGTNVAVISPQASGVLEIHNTQSLPFFLGGKADVDEYDAIKPSYIIRILDGDYEEALVDGRCWVETSKRLSKARIRPHPEYRSLDYEIIAQGRHHLESLRMVEAVNKVITRVRRFNAQGSGQDFDIDSHDPVRSVNDVIPYVSCRLKVRGYFDINKQETEFISSGQDNFGDSEYIDSGTNIDYDECPLIIPSGITFNIRPTSGC